MTWLDEIAGAILPLDAASMAAASAHLDRLTKPPGSLGRLEDLAVQLAGIRGRPVTAIDNPAVVVFAADHGVTAQGVSAYPPEVTAQMVANFAAGGAAINVLARAAGARLVVVDIGVAGDAEPARDVEPARDAEPADDHRGAGSAAATGTGGPGARLVLARVASGTRDMTMTAAMTRDEARAAMDVGRRVVEELVTDGLDLLAVGEMGIGNTTAASAIVAALTGRPPAEVTGRGTGVDDPGLGRKVRAIEAALALHRPDPADPLSVLAAVGGLEIAGLVGAILAAAAARVPVVLDGFITGAAGLLAAALAPNLAGRLIASHRSVEPGHAIVLDRLGLEPLLDLRLRLGEGSGAALAIPLLVSAARICGEMATFEGAGVSNRG